MELRPEFLLPAIAKTLKDVILPALDETHQVAQEQLKLAIGFLDIMASQRHLLFAFDLDELARHAATAGELAALLGTSADHADLLAQAGKIAGSGAGDPDGIVALTRQLRAAIVAMIEDGYGRGDAALAAKIHSKMNDYAKVQLLRERGWALPMGFENTPDAVPAIAGQLGKVTA